MSIKLKVGKDGSPGSEIVVEKVVRQNYNEYNRGGKLTPAGYSLHFDPTSHGIMIPTAIGMITTPDLLIGAFERKSIVPDGLPFEVDYDSLNTDEKSRMPYAIQNGRYGVVYDASGNFITMDMTPQWAKFAEYVSNVSEQGRLKVICANYSINHQGKEPDCYSLHADLMDFERFIKENDGMIHGYIKVKIETLARTFLVCRHKIGFAYPSWLSETGAFRRECPPESISSFIPSIGGRLNHSPNQKQHFGYVYETVVDTKVAQQVLAGSPGVFFYGTPPKGIVPIGNNGTPFHNPKDFCNLPQN